MKTHGIFGLMLGAIALTGCGGTPDRTCDEQQVYQLAAEGRRIDTPLDLSALDPSKEIPLPEVSPGGQRERGLPCLDRPPAVIGGS